MLGTSGIRGIYGKDITSLNVFKWTNAFARDLPYLYIGRDIRESSLPLSLAAASGALSAGIDVYDLGIASTGIMGFAANSIMITASHNPQEYNGIKFIKDKRELMRSEGGFLNDNLKQDAFANYYHAEIFDDYLNALSIFDFNFQHEFFEVNSAVQTFFDWYVETTHEKLYLYNNVPVLVRESNPTKLSLKNGFAYDADGDRVAYFDNGLISGDLLFASVARYMAEYHNKRTLVVTLELPKYLMTYLQNYYSHIRVVPVGSPFVGYELQKYNHAFGGEPNGEYIFPEISYVPDAIASTALITEMKKEHLFTLPDITPYPVERKNYHTQRKHQVIEQLKQHIPEFSDIDGLLIEGDDFKVLIRASGTEPLIRLTVEAKNKKTLNELIKRYEKLILPLL